MPNVNAPKGFIPVQHIDGSPWNGKANLYLIPSTDATAVYIGDAVLHGGSSGAAGTTVNGIDCEGIPTVTRATAGTTDICVGIVVGFLANQDNLSQLYRPASVNRLALVVDDPGLIMEIQEDALVTPVAAASVGLNAAFTTTAGSTTTGVSGMQLDSDTVAVTATLPIRVYGLVKRPDNAFNTGGAGTDQAKFLVKWNLHRYLSTSGV